MTLAYPEWKRQLWRGFRTAVSVAVAQTALLKVDWSDPSAAIQAVSVAFISGFLVAFGMFVRDFLGGKNQDAFIQKLPI